MRLRSLVLFLPLLSLAQSKPPVTLDVLATYRAPQTPRAIWAPTGSQFLYEESGRLHLYDADSQRSAELIELKTLENSPRKPPPAKRFDWQNRRVSEQTVQWMPDGKSALLVVEGDLFLFDVAAKKSTQLTATPVAERDPKPSPDGKRIAFRIEHDLYVMSLESKTVTRLTHDGSENLLNGELDWVYPEELDLGTAYWWAPDSARLAYLQFDTSKIGTYPHADLSGVTPVAEPQKYPQAGTPNSDVRLGVISATGGETVWMQLGDRANLLARVAWTPDSLIVQRLPRIQNKIDVLRCDPKTGVVKTLFSESDRAWINISDELRVLDNGKRLLWSSERTGFRHLYVYDVARNQFRQVTSGDWEVTDVAGVDEKAGKVWFVSTQASPLERQLYVTALDGGTPTRISAGPGTHAISMNASASHYLGTHSSLKTPPVTALHRADGTRIAVFREAKPPEFDLLPTEIVSVKADDGDTMYARLIRPPNFDANKKYPALVIVYGGPHAQAVRDTWSGPSRDQALAQRGFVIWQLDNRGSAGRGHAWESKLYRRFGKQELEDQKTGVKHLIGMGFVDPPRIGVYGWSYGGYMTLYSLLNEPGLFAAGVAGAPVVDWRLYDTIYTERYLGLPQENETGYRDSSPVTYADKLQGKLLLIHCFGDDNVLFQNSFQMASALQKAGKTFEMMVYPDKSHAVIGPGRHQLNHQIVEFFERTLLGK